MDLREKQYLIQSAGLLDIIQLNQTMSHQDYQINMQLIDQDTLIQRYQQFASEQIYQQWIFADVVSRYSLSSTDLQYLDLQTIITLGINVNLFIQLLQSFNLQVYDLLIGIQDKQTLISSYTQVKLQHETEEQNFVLYKINPNKIKILEFQNQQLITTENPNILFEQKSQILSLNEIYKKQKIFEKQKEIQEKIQNQQEIFQNKTFQFIQVLRQQFQDEKTYIFDVSNLLTQYILNLKKKQEIDFINLQIEVSSEVKFVCVQISEFPSIQFLKDFQFKENKSQESLQYDYSNSTNIFDMSHENNSLFDFDTSQQNLSLISQAQTLFDNFEFQTGSQLNNWQSLPVQLNSSWSPSVSIPLSLNSLGTQITNLVNQNFTGYIRYHFPSYRILIIESEYISRQIKRTQYNQVVVFIYEKINIPYICGYKCIFSIDVDKSNNDSKIVFANTLTVIEDNNQVYNVYNNNSSEQAQSLVYYQDSIQNIQKSHVFGFAKLPTGIPVHFQTNVKGLLGSLCLLDNCIPNTEQHPCSAKFIQVSQQFQQKQQFLNGKIILLVDKERQHILLDNSFKTPQIKDQDNVDIIQGFLVPQEVQNCYIDLVFFRCLLPKFIINQINVGDNILFNITYPSCFKCIDQVCIDHKQSLEKINQIISKTIKFSLQKANKFKDKESCWTSSLITTQQSYKCKFVINNQICGFKPLDYEFYQKVQDLLENGDSQLIFPPQRLTVQESKTIFNQKQIYEVYVAFKSSKIPGKFILEAASVFYDFKDEFINGRYQNGYLQSQNANYYIISQKYVFKQNQQIFTKRSGIMLIDDKFQKVVQDVSTVQQTEETEFNKTDLLYKY